MKTLTVTTKGAAERAAVATLFHSGGTATKPIRYDGGKYANNLKGRVADYPDKVVSVFTVQRKDSEGAYWALYAFVKGN